MRSNEARRKLEAGLPTLGATVSCASPLVAEVMGHLGYDWVILDLQHGENNLGNLAALLTAVSATPTVPWVRVVSNDGPLIQRVLDLGAYGVVVPLVNDAREAEAAVRAMRYPPKGDRSWGPIRGALYGGPDYHAGAERELQLVVMIETAEGIKNADEILAVDGVDGCLIGTNDFSLSFGLTPRPVPDSSPMDPRVEEAVGAVLEAARRNGKAPGIFTTDPGMASERVRQGFRIISMLGDLAGLRAGCGAMLREVRQTADEVGATGSGEGGR